MDFLFAQSQAAELGNVPHFVISEFLQVGHGWSRSKGISG
jgi:hypothetical protein